VQFALIIIIITELIESSECILVQDTDTSVCLLCNRFRDRT